MNDPQISSSAPVGERIAHLAQSRLGLAWLHQGRTPDGLDCVGLVFYALAGVGWYPDDPKWWQWTDYTRRVSEEHILKFARLEAVRELTTLDECEVGDVILIRYEGAEAAQHVGILTRKRSDGVVTWIHASTEEGCVVEHRLSPQWKQRFVAGFRFVEDETDG